MEINLAGRVAIVTGGARGIGREIVRTLASENVTVVTADVDQGALETLGAELEDLGVSHLEIACDITEKTSVADMIEKVVSDLGRIDVLVNNAGVTAHAPIGDMSEVAWDLIHDVNLKGTFLMCQAVLPIMKKQRFGRIINASSFAALVPIYGSAAYASSKSGVAHFTRALAGEVGPWNITANAYAPGMIPTEMNKFAERSERDQNQLLDTLSLRRWGSASDIAHLICYLASDFAGYITGTTIDISGGKLGSQIPRLAYEAAELLGEYDFERGLRGQKDA